MQQPDKNKKKVTTTKKEMPQWGKPYKREKLPDGGYKYYYRRSVPGSGKPKNGTVPGKKMSNEAWKKYLASETPEQKIKRLDREKGRTEEKTETTSPAKPMPKRKVNIPGVENKREVSGKVPTTTTPPPPEKKRIGMYAKKKKSKDRTWTPGKKGLKGLATAAGATLLGKKVYKDPAGYHVGTKVKQSTTRPVSEKMKGEKDVVETQLGSEQRGKGDKMKKRTQSGLATAQTGKGKKLKSIKKKRAY